MSTQSSATPTDLGKRLRSLRGDLSQEEFAHKVGLSRSAVANYETGRTTPKPSVLRKISLAMGVEPKLLSDGLITDPSDLFAALGLPRDGSDQLTKDEWAIIQVLRICEFETAKQVVELILGDIHKGNDISALRDTLTLGNDVHRLAYIERNAGLYNRGVSLQGLSELLVLS